MLKTVRKHQTGIMLVVAIIVIIAFAFLYDPNRDAYKSSNDVIRIFERNYRSTQVARLEKLREVLYGLGEYEYVFGMTQLDRRFGALDNRESTIDFVFNTIVLRHEAEDLAIDPTTDEIEKAIKTLPAFQSQDGGFDLGRFENIQTYLARDGISLPFLYEGIADTIRFDKIRELITSGILPSLPEVNQYLDAQTSQIFASLVRIPSSQFEDDLALTDEEIQEFYEENSDALLADEKRAFDYIAFRRPVRTEASGEGETATDAESDEAFKARSRAFATAINRFATDLVEAGAEAELRELAAVPALAEYTDGVQSAEAFAQESPPQELADDPTLVDSAFGHNPALGPVGDPIDRPEGFTFFKLTGVVPPEPLSLEEAQPRIEEILTAQKLAEKTSEAAAQAKEAITAALAEGKSFAEAAEAAGYPAEDVPMFASNQRPQGIVEAGEVVQAVSALNPGEVSNPIASADATLLVYLESREQPLEPITDVAKDATADQVGRITRQAAFTNWFSERKQRAEPTVLSRGDG
ncbi:hypothetical protein BH23VER1_BH23VER1_10760 [soil metagenome]